MIVVVILSLTAAVAAMALRGGRGDRAPVYARTLFTLFHEARSTALTTGLPARVRLIPPAGASVVPRAVLETPDPVTKAFNATTPVGGLEAPNDVYITQVKNFPDTTTTPPSPLLLPVEEAICFMPDGKVNVIVLGTTNICPPTPAASGATVYVRSFDDLKHYKILIYGLTGMPKILEREQGW
jgi:hypothetical protein